MKLLSIFFKLASLVKPNVYGHLPKDNPNNHSSEQPAGEDNDTPITLQRDREYSTFTEVPPRYFERHR